MASATTRADPKLRPIVVAYCNAVQSDVSGHPIQRADRCIPADMVGKPFCKTADQLYVYTTCTFFEEGTPLPVECPISEAIWVLMDSVYIRTDDKGPTNADRDKARRAGFSDEGLRSKGDRARDQKKARQLWQSSVKLWGPPQQPTN